MKKACILLLVQLLVFGTASYGATSDDVYVRKDVFDAKMEAMFNRLHVEIVEVRGDIKELSRRVDGIDARIDDLRNTLEGHIGDLRNDIYLGLVILGIVVGLPAVQKALQKWEERKATRDAARMPFTLDDVRRLIEENNARMAGKAQA